MSNDIKVSPYGLGFHMIPTGMSLQFELFLTSYTYPYSTEYISIARNLIKAYLMSNTN